MKLRDLKIKITAADTFLFLVLLALSASGFVFVDAVMPAGNEVIIEANGVHTHTLRLDEDATVNVQGASGTTVVEIRDGKVRVRDSDCPNKICVKQGWIDRGAIVCLPNRVIVRLEAGGTGTAEFDAITR